MPGVYPVAPARMASGGFSVNNQDRNDVISFWNAVYQASEGYEARIKWTGNYTGNSGTVAPAFVSDVERRVNYFRAICGLNANTKVSATSTVVIDPLDPFKPSAATLKATAAQDAALMLVRNYNPATGAAAALTHNPPNTLIGWSPQAWNASAKGNLGFGLYGPAAITEYMIEQLASSTATSSWNTLVGHRRWALYSRATVFATGDQPGKSAAVPPSNVLYVLQKPSEMGPEGTSGFIAYPPAGYFPAPLNTKYWSFSRAGANFSLATVKMTDSTGKSVPVGSLRRSTEFGDPALIWDVSPTVSVQSVPKDTTYNVSISGIVGLGIPTSYNYSVTLINPDRLLSYPQPLGASSVPAKGSATYTFAPPHGAEGFQLIASQKNSTPWKEDAETTTKSKIIDGTGANYPIIAKATSFSGFSVPLGKAAFHLTFPTAYDVIQRGVPDQTLEIDRDILANAKAKLTFLYRRGFMTKTSFLAVESSSDGGISWTAIGTPIKGVSDTQFDTGISSASLTLPKSTTPVRIRFRYFTTGGSIYTQEAAPNYPTGIFLDEISATNCDWLEQKKVTTYPATAAQFIFNAKSAGIPLVKGAQWNLRLRTKLGGKWFPAGTAKTVKVTP